MLDLYDLIIQKANLPGFYTLGSQKFDILYSENPKIQSASQYTQALKVLDPYNLIIQQANLPVVWKY